VNEDRILLIEDTSEIQLHKPNLVRFEARQAQPDLPAITIRDLLDCLGATNFLPKNDSVGVPQAAFEQVTDVMAGSRAAPGVLEADEIWLVQLDFRCVLYQKNPVLVTG